MINGHQSNTINVNATYTGTHSGAAPGSGAAPAFAYATSSHITYTSHRSPHVQEKLPPFGKSKTDFRSSQLSKGSMKMKTASQDSDQEQFNEQKARENLQLIDNILIKSETKKQISIVNGVGRNQANSQLVSSTNKSKKMKEWPTVPQQELEASFKSVPDSVINQDPSVTKSPGSHRIKISLHEKNNSIQKPALAQQTISNNPQENFYNNQYKTFYELKSLSKQGMKSYASQKALAKPQIPGEEIENLYQQFKPNDFQQRSYYKSHQKFVQKQEEKQTLMKRNKSVNQLGKEVVVISFASQMEKRVAPTPAKPEFVIKKPSAYQHSSLFGKNKIRNDGQQQFLTAQSSAANLPSLDGETAKSVFEKQRQSVYKKPLNDLDKLKMKITKHLKERALRAQRKTTLMPLQQGIRASTADNFRSYENRATDSQVSNESLPQNAYAPIGDSIITSSAFPIQGHLNQQLNSQITLQIQNLNRKNSQFGVVGTNYNSQNVDQDGIRSGTSFLMKKKDIKTIQQMRCLPPFDKIRIHESKKNAHSQCRGTDNKEQNKMQLKFDKNIENKNQASNDTVDDLYSPHMMDTAVVEGQKSISNSDFISQMQLGAAKFEGEFEKSHLVSISQKSKEEILQQYASRRMPNGDGQEETQPERRSENPATPDVQGDLIITGQNSSRNSKLKDNGAKSKTLEVQRQIQDGKHISSQGKEHGVEINMNAVLRNPPEKATIDSSPPARSKNFGEVEELVKKLETSRNSVLDQEDVKVNPQNSKMFGSYRRLQRHLHQMVPEQVFNVDFYSKSIDQNNFAASIKEHHKYLQGGQPKYISNKLRGGINGTEKFGGAIVLTTSQWQSMQELKRSKKANV